MIMNMRKIILPIAMLLLLIIATIGVTFAAFTFTKQGTVENVIESSTILLTYTEGKTGIMLNEAYPMSDETGKMLTGENNVFDFTVTATLGKAIVISYEVSAVKIPITDMTPLEDNEIKLYLERAIDPDSTYQEVLPPSNFVPIENQTEVGSPLGAMILDSGTFYNEGTTIHHYRLRLWVDENAKIPNGEAKKYGVKVNAYAKQLATDKFTGESCFSFDSASGTITGYDNNCPKDVIIPFVINGTLVTTIGDHSFQNKELTSVSIPESIKTIEAYSFESNQLSNIEISKEVTKVGTCAFKNNHLTNLIISSGTTIIEGQAFSNNQLTHVAIPEGTTTIAYNVFANNQITSVTIPESVTTISGFYNNRLTSLTIPESVTTIGNYAFSRNRLTNIKIPESVTSIGDKAFQSNQLTSIKLPSNLTNISVGVFDDNQLTDVDIPESVTTIGDYAFRYNQLTKVIIPQNVVTIGSQAFYKDKDFNQDLIQIINKTGRSFAWHSITGSSNRANFVTGTIPHTAGDIVVTAN